MGLHDESQSQWFWDHYREAVNHIVAICDRLDVPLRDRTIADVGCGDGIMATGLCRRAEPASLIGFDITPTDREHLIARCREEGVGELPAQLEFRGSGEAEFAGAGRLV